MFALDKNTYYNNYIGVMVLKFLLTIVYHTIQHENQDNSSEYNVYIKICTHIRIKQ